jgi:hypothetical protein
MCNGGVMEVWWRCDGGVMEVCNYVAHCITGAL